MVLTATPAPTDLQARTATKFSLQSLTAVIPLSSDWIGENETRAKRVARYRRYFDGDHDAKLTTEMRKLLRIQDSDDGFALNMMPTVVQTMADRCLVQTIEATVEQDGPLPDEPTDTQQADPSEAATKWAQSVLMANMFDVLQNDLHEGVLLDGDGGLMVGFDNDKQQVTWTYEPAYDGISGMLFVYRSRNQREMAAAIKIWQVEEPGDAISGDVNAYSTRVNIYYPDRIIKYAAKNGGGKLEGYIDENGDGPEFAWTMPDGEPIGIPVVHFANGGRYHYGVSELRNAITPQNALNRFNYSAVMAAELTGFPLYLALGFAAPQALTPGMIIEIAELPADSKVDFKKVEASPLTPILDMINLMREMVASITRTPAPELMSSGSNKSAEYLKQLEVGLLGKVRRFQVRAGANWEQAMDLSHRVQTAYGRQKPPTYTRAATVWQEAAIRNDTEVVTNALKMRDVVGDKQTLRFVAPTYDLSEADIEAILAEKLEQDSLRVRDVIGANLPEFGAPEQAGMMQDAMMAQPKQPTATAQMGMMGSNAQ